MDKYLQALKVLYEHLDFNVASVFSDFKNGLVTEHEDRHGKHYLCYHDDNENVGIWLDTLEIFAIY